MVPPPVEGENWKVKYAWQDQGKSAADTEIDVKNIADGTVGLHIPFDSLTVPGIRGKLRFVVSTWNPDAVMNE